MSEKERPELAERMYAVYVDYVDWEQFGTEPVCWRDLDPHFQKAWRSLADYLRTQVAHGMKI